MRYQMMFQVLVKGYALPLHIAFTSPFGMDLDYYY